MTLPDHGRADLTHAPAPRLGIQVDAVYHDAWAAITLSGELDVYSQGHARKALAQAAAAGGHRLAVVMSELDFLDSNGLGVLLAAYKLAKTHGGRLCIVDASERVLKVFRIAGLTTTIPAFSSLEDAAAWLTQP